MTPNLQFDILHLLNLILYSLMKLQNLNHFFSTDTRSFSLRLFPLPTPHFPKPSEIHTTHTVLCLAKFTLLVCMTSEALNVLRAPTLSNVCFRPIRLRIVLHIGQMCDSRPWSCTLISLVMAR